MHTKPSTSIVNAFILTIMKFCEMDYWVKLFSSDKLGGHLKALSFNIYEIANANTIEAVNELKIQIANKIFDDNYILGFDGFFNEDGMACNNKQRAKHLELYHYGIIIPNPRYGVKSEIAAKIFLKMCGVKRITELNYNRSMQYLLMQHNHK